MIQAVLGKQIMVWLGQESELSKAQSCAVTTDMQNEMRDRGQRRERVNHKGFTTSFNRIGRGGYRPPLLIDGTNIILSQITTSTLKSATANNAASITASFGPLPYPNEDSQQLLAAIQSVQGILGNIFIAGAMAMLLPAFLVSIVQERELRIKAMMKMNGGLSDGIYWAVTVSWTYAFHLVTNLWLWIVYDHGGRLP